MQSEGRHECGSAGGWTGNGWHHHHHHGWGGHRGGWGGRPPFFFPFFMFPLFALGAFFFLFWLLKWAAVPLLIVGGLALAFAAFNRWNDGGDWQARRAMWRARWQAARDAWEAAGADMPDGEKPKRDDSPADKPKRDDSPYI
jgi:hypothetical protein